MLKTFLTARNSGFFSYIVVTYKTYEEGFDMINEVINMELSILNWIQSLRTPGLDRFFAVFTTLGDHGELWLIILLILFVMKKTRKVAILGLIALVVELILVSGVIKPIVMRPRPFFVNPVDLVVPAPRGSSFPSGHAASSFAVVMTLYFNKIKYKPAYVTLAVIMAFSRLYVYVHYPSDVLVGTLLGIFIAYEVTKYQKTIFKIMDTILIKIGIRKEIAQ